MQAVILKLKVKRFFNDRFRYEPTISRLFLYNLKQQLQTTMKNFTAACLLAFGASAIMLESETQRVGATDLEQLRKDGTEFLNSLIDAIEEANDSDKDSDQEVV